MDTMDRTNNVPPMITAGGPPMTTAGDQVITKEIKEIMKNRDLNE